MQVAVRKYKGPEISGKKLKKVRSKEEKVILEDQRRTYLKLNKKRKGKGKKRD